MTPESGRAEKAIDGSKGFWSRVRREAKRRAISLRTKASQRCPGVEIGRFNAPLVGRVSSGRVHDGIAGQDELLEVRPALWLLVAALLADDGRERVHVAEVSEAIVRERDVLDIWERGAEKVGGKD